MQASRSISTQTPGDYFCSTILQVDSKSHLLLRRSSAVEGEILEEEEFVGTGEVVRIEKTEEVIIILVVIIAAIF